VNGEALAALGGQPRFPDRVPFVRPSLPDLAEVTRLLEPSFASGIITDGQLVHRLEERAAERLQVNDVVAVGSCTLGLMLAWRVLDPGGPVVLPGFTFSASAHAAYWNGLELRFAECDPESFQLDPHDLKGRLAGARGVTATHIFGAPCQIEVIESVARDAGIPLVVDAAHAFGATRDGRPVGGFGQAEVFSLTPTKPLVAGEGGLVATNDQSFAAELRVARNYGNPGDYDSRLVGLNGRMSDLHAAVALASLERFDEDLATRRRWADRYRKGIESVPGLAMQTVRPEDDSTWKDLTIQVDPERFGLDVGRLQRLLSTEGVDTRRYFYPPVHQHQVYRDRFPARLPVTEWVAGRVISLPIWPGLKPEVVDALIDLLGDLHEHADALGSASA
jgi:dTDP-4-amino-4,6-dideoxygalactose transaminase